MDPMEENKEQASDLTEMDIAMQGQQEVQPDPIAQYMESTGTRYEDVVQEPLDQEHQALYDATGTPSGSSIAQQAADYVDKTFFNNVLTPELMKDAERELEALTDDELEQLWTEETISKELEDKLPNYIKAKKLQDGDTVIQSYVKPTLSYTADLVQGATMGALKGMANVPTATIDFLNLLDDSTGLDVIPNDAVKALDEATSAFTKGLDEGIPDGILPSLSASVAQNWVGLGAFKWIPGTGKAMTLFRSALASSTAFGVHGENIFNVLAQHMDKDSTIRSALYTLIAVNEDDPTLIAMVKNSLASVFTDVTTEKLMKALGKAARVFRPRVKKVAEQVTDSADEAVSGSGKAAQGVADNIDDASASAGRTASGISDNVDEAMSGKTAQGAAESVDDAEYKQPNRNSVDDADNIRGKSDPFNNRETLDLDYDDFDFDDPEVKEAVSDLNDACEQAAKEKASSGAGKVPPNNSGPSDGGAASSSSSAKAPQTDAEALLERAQKLMADTDLDTDFHPTHDVINPKIVQGYCEDEGVERLLQLGNDVPEVNSLGRDASQYTVQHQGEVLAQAKVALEDVDGLVIELKDLAKASNKLPAAIVSARQLLADHTRYLGGLLQKLNRADISSVDKKALIDNELTQALLNTAKVSSFFDTLSTNVARALKAHQFDMLTPDANWLKGDVYQNCAAKISQMSDGVKVKMARIMADSSSPKASRRFLEAFSRSGWKKGMDISAELAYNSLLSSAKTGFRNIMGNTIQQALIMPLDNIAHGLIFKNKEIFNDGWKAFWAMRQSFAEAWEVTYKAIRMGKNVMGLDSGLVEAQHRAFSAINFGLDPDGTYGKLIDKIGSVVNIPTRYLSRTDEFFQQLAARSNVRTYLWSEAEKLFEQGLAPHGMRKADFIMDYVSQHFGEYFIDATDSMGNVIKSAKLNMDAKYVAERAMDAAQRATFTQALKKGSPTQHLAEAMKDNPALRVVVPFLKVPRNILAEGVSHTAPINYLQFLSSDFRKALAAGGIEQQRAVAKMAVGSLFTASAVAAAYCGNITGAAPRNAKIRDTLLSQGWRPYSVKVGNTWISYDGIEPISTVMGIIADYTQAYKDSSGDIDFHRKGDMSEFERLAGSVLSAVSQNITNKSYLMGFAEFLDVLTSDSPEKVKGFLSSLGGVAIPNAFQSIRKLIDPSVRECRGYIDGLMNKLPIFNESLPLKYDWLTGEPVHYMGERASGISPFVFSTTEGSDEQKAMGKVVGLIPSPQRRINNNPLTGQQYSDFCRLHGTVKISGKTLKQSLAKAYERYKDLPDDELKVKLTDITLKFREAAKKELIKSYPELKINPNKVKKQQKKQMTVASQPTVSTVRDTLSNFV